MTTLTKVKDHAERISNPQATEEDFNDVAQLLVDSSTFDTPEDSSQAEALFITLLHSPKVSPALRVKLTNFPVERFFLPHNKPVKPVSPEAVPVLAATSDLWVLMCLAGDPSTDADLLNQIGVEVSARTVYASPADVEIGKRLLRCLQRSPKVSEEVKGQCDDALVWSITSQPTL